MRPLAPLLAAALAVLAVPAPASAADVPLPRDDAFYRYDGTTPLAQQAPGAVLKTRDVTLAADTNAVPVPATQVLYRTSDELGRPTATVTTVVAPPTALVAPKIVGYLSFYDSLSDKCDPSYTLRGGDPGAANTQLTDIEQALVAQYVATGYVVTVPDFEGPGLHWTAGQEAGRSTLDALRATESFLALPRTTPVGLSGYSGGSIAADWASELAPAYAPEINLVGVAEGGLPVHFAHNLTYIEGSETWSGIIPAVVVALGRAYDLPLTQFLSDKGKALTAKAQDACIGDVSGTTPGLRSEELLKPQYRPLLAQKPFVDIVNRLVMGTAPGHPKGPLLIEVGNDPANAQGQGDDIMVTGDVMALARQYCDQGVPVEFHVLENAAHSQAALEFEPQASAFLAARFAGVPFVDNCASVGKGNDLSPIEAQSSRPARPTAPRPAAPAAAPSGPSLPSTGGTPALVALFLLGSGLVVRRVRSA